MAYNLIATESTLLIPMSRITTSNTLTSLSLLGLSPPVPLSLSSRSVPFVPVGSFSLFSYSRLLLNIL